MHSVNQDLVLAVRDERPVSSQDWASFVAAANETRQRFGRIRLLVMTEGPGPTPAQRKMATDAGWMNNSSPMAIVTDQFLVRQIVTAFRWFGMNMQSFRKRDLAAACMFLGLSPAELEWVQRESLRLRGALRAQASVTQHS
jgi:hypothetical protein